MTRFNKTHSDSSGLRPSPYGTVVAAAALALAACSGEKPVTSSNRSAEPVFKVQGTVTQGVLAAPPAQPLEVGVLWLNLLDDNATVLIEATPADVIGDSLPAGFDVSVLQPPSDALLGTALVSYTEDGSSTQPVDRSRVGFGVVVVAPEGTFASLPSSVPLSPEFISGTGVPGPLLSQFTYVSPFAVRYVQGATAQGLTIRDINGVESTLQDMSVFDIGAWARGIDTALCRDGALGEGWAAPEVQNCISARTESLAVAEAAQQACVNACGPTATDATEGEREAATQCSSGCTLDHPTRGDFENQCLFDHFNARADDINTRCGAVAGPEGDFRNSRLLEAGGELTLPLGASDVRKAFTAGGFVFIAG
jgi:hypothetical protein